MTILSNYLIKYNYFLEIESCREIWTFVNIPRLLQPGTGTHAIECAASKNLRIISA